MGPFVHAFHEHTAPLCTSSMSIPSSVPFIATLPLPCLWRSRVFGERIRAVR
jgi:hypothetical protein